MRDTVLARWRCQRNRDELFAIQGARPAGPVLVKQSLNAARFVTGPPIDHRLTRDREPARDLDMSNTVSSEQHDPRPQDQTRFRRRRPHPFLQLITITVRHSQRRCSHTQFNQTTPPNYFRRAALGNSASSSAAPTTTTSTTSGPSLNIT